MQQMSFTLIGPIDIDDLALRNVSNRFRGVECIPANQASTIQGSRNWICMQMALSSMAPFQAQGVWKAPACSGTTDCLQSRCLSGHGINGTPFLRDVSTMCAGNSQLQKLEQETIRRLDAQVSRNPQAAASKLKKLSMGNFIASS